MSVSPTGSSDNFLYSLEVRLDNLKDAAHVEENVARTSTDNTPVGSPERKEVEQQVASSSLTARRTRRIHKEPTATAHRLTSVQMNEIVKMLEDENMGASSSVKADKVSSQSLSPKRSQPSVSGQKAYKSAESETCANWKNLPSFAELRNPPAPKNSALNSAFVPFNLNPITENDINDLFALNNNNNSVSSSEEDELDIQEELGDVQQEEASSVSKEKNEPMSLEQIASLSRSRSKPSASSSAKSSSTEKSATSLEDLADLFKASGSKKRSSRSASKPASSSEAAPMTLDMLSEAFRSKGERTFDMIDGNEGISNEVVVMEFRAPREQCIAALEVIDKKKISASSERIPAKIAEVMKSLDADVSQEVIAEVADILEIKKSAVEKRLKNRHTKQRTENLAAVREALQNLKARYLMQSISTAAK